MRTIIIAAVLAAFTSNLSAQTANQATPSNAPHRKARTPDSIPTPPASRPMNQPASPARTSPSPTSSAQQPVPVIQISPPAPGNPVTNRAQTVQSVPVMNAAPQTSAAPEPKVPPAAPMVSYSNGELTVMAQNASLGEVLNAVRAATGIKVEGPGGGPERITAKIGPAPVRDVLLTLLEGSRYDFAMLGSVNDPQRVERLLLTPRTASSSSASYTAAPSPSQTEQAAAPPPQPGEDDDNEGFAEPAKPAPAPGANAPATPPGTQQVKTPEQLLEDLRKLEADKAQQQQQQTAPADANAPRPPRPPK